MFVAVEPKPNEVPVIVPKFLMKFEVTSPYRKCLLLFCPSPKKQFNQHRPHEHRKHIHIMGNKCELGLVQV